MKEPCLIHHNMLGENPLRCITQDEKGPSLYYNPFLPYILILVKNNESKVIKNYRRTIF
jgi:hypothetical protein